MQDAYICGLQPHNNKSNYSPKIVAFCGVIIAPSISNFRLFSFSSRIHLWIKLAENTMLCNHTNINCYYQSIISNTKYTYTRLWSNDISDLLAINNQTNLRTEIHRILLQRIVPIIPCVVIVDRAITRMINNTRISANFSRFAPHEFSLQNAW